MISQLHFDATFIAYTSVIQILKRGQYTFHYTLTGWRGIDIGSYQSVASPEGRDGDGHGPSTCCGEVAERRGPPSGRSDGGHSNHTGYPSWGRYVSRQVSWLAGAISAGTAARRETDSGAVH